MPTPLPPSPPTRLNAPRRGITDVDRRAALLGLGGTAVAALLASCTSRSSSSSSSSTTSAAPTGTGGTDATVGSTGTTPGTTAATPTFTSQVCELVPEIGDGPFYLDLDLVRRDIAAGQDGLPLELWIRVVDPSTGCTPREGAAVQVWQANAEGWYSGYVGDVGPLGPDGPPAHQTPTDDQTFLRGTQFTDADGIAWFESIYPSWYLGRTNHVHVKVLVDNTAVATTQLFFDQAVNDEVAATAPYNGHTGQDTTNANDAALRSVSVPELVMWDLTPRDAGGYRATITIGIPS